MRIGIIGGGASGLMAAVTAAGLGAKVTILEKKDRIGKKILATGNGKCNFTNKKIEETDYLSRSERIYEDYVRRFDEKRVLDFFASQGMLTKERNGCFYPRSEQASTILDLFRKRLEEQGVRIITQAFPESLKKKKDGFEVKAAGRSFYFDRLILACGSFAGEKEQKGVWGYDYAKSFGHTLVPVVPALVQLRAGKEREEFKTVAGVRCEARITLYIDGKKEREEQGELQLTDYGISGIPVFQLSRHAAYGFYYGQEVSVSIDLLPEYSPFVWEEIVKKKWESFSGQASLEDFLLGFLNKKLNLLFLRKRGYKPQILVKEIGMQDILKLCRQMKNWRVGLTETNPFLMAQVCAGGVSMDEVDADLESRKVKGLFFAGEILDVEGRCGGYNLQWAWTSGYLAGRAAAGKRKGS